MRPHPRIRKTVKWIGLVLTGLLVVVWVASGWNTLMFQPAKGLRIGCGGGRFIADSLPNGDMFGNGGFVWWTTSEGGGPIWDWTIYWDHFANAWQLHLPIWLALAPVLVTTIAACRLDAIARRRGAGKCTKCSYDRAGISAAAPCPECGSPAPALTPPPPRSP